MIFAVDDQFAIMWFVGVRNIVHELLGGFHLFVFVFDLILARSFHFFHEVRKQSIAKAFNKEIGFFIYVEDLTHIYGYSFGVAPGADDINKLAFYVQRFSNIIGSTAGQNGYWQPFA